MTGPNDTCGQCPKRCSYGEHLHIFEVGIKTIDHKAMDELRQEMENNLKGCRK